MRCRRFLELVVLVSSLAPSAAAQFVSEKHRELGIDLFARPRNFDAVPIQPGEPWVKLYYKERPGDPKRKSATVRRFEPELRVIIVPHLPPDDPAESSQVEAAEEQEGAEKKPPIVDFASYLAAEHPKYEVEELGPGKRSKDFVTACYRLEYETRLTQWMGFAYVWSGSGRDVALVGLCFSEDYGEMRKLWTSVGDKLRLAEPQDLGFERKKLERYYASKRYSRPEYRIAVREALVTGWKAEDTEHFIVVYNTPDQPLLRKVMRDIELLRGEYLASFPAVGDLDAVSTVRICKDREEYIAYGGSPWSAGYWNFVTEELVLYHAEKEQKGGRGDDSDTFVTLYHEAFHQYIHYSTGELPPHSWFNEGFGDYFGGARIHNGKVRDIGLNPWRIARIQWALEQGRWTPWEKILPMSQAEFYAANRSVNYAQGWSMIYFLRHAPAVQEHRTWSRILPSYFETLKRVYQEELALLGHPADLKAREPAREEARKAALAVAFEGVDVSAIESAWRTFIGGL